MGKYKDLTGKRFGKLVVLYRILNYKGENKYTTWMCKCDCGNTKIILRNALCRKDNPTRSCGCDRFLTEEWIGKQFGNLTVIGTTKKIKTNRSALLCKCSCGNTVAVMKADLTRKKSPRISCGCKKMSSGELKVIHELKKYGINYIFQYTILDLITSRKGHPIIDFAIVKDDLPQAFIEYQGEQHYRYTNSYFGKIEREETDEMKINYCEAKRIPLFEIKYDEEVAPAVQKILSTLKLIPCQAS